MSNDLIRRSDAIKALGEEPYVWTDDDEFAQGERSQWIDDMSAINAIPSAGRPQGEWIYCEDEHGIDGYRCSNCGKHIAWDYQHKFINFIDDYHTCPFCDARMKGADDDR